MSYSDQTFNLQSRENYAPQVGFLDPSSKFPSQPATQQPIPQFIQNIHNDLQKTICVPYTSTSSSNANSWFSDFVTDVSHDNATRRVAVASAVPFIPLPTAGSNSFADFGPNPHHQHPPHPTTQSLIDQFSQFQLSSQQPPSHHHSRPDHPNNPGDVDDSSVLITTPQPTITIFEHSNNEWRVQSVLPRGHIGNIYKIDWCDPEFGTFVAACSDDGLVHVYEEIVLDQQTTAIINDNQLLSETNLLNPLHKQIAVIQAQQAAVAAAKQTHAASSHAESTFHLPPSPFLTQHQYSNASVINHQQGSGKKKDELRAQMNTSTPLLPTPSALLQQSLNPQPTTATSSSVPSLLQHTITKPPKTTWIRSCSFQVGLDAVVYLEWAPRHIGMRLATCCLDGKLRIYDLQTNDEHELTVADYDCTSCAWNSSPWDTPMLLTVGDMYAQVYEYSEKGSRWYRQCILPGHADTLTACAWAPSYGRTFHILATGDRSGIVRIFKFFPRGFDGSGMSGAAAELLSLLIPYQYQNFHFKTRNNSASTQPTTSPFLPTNPSSLSASSPTRADGTPSPPQAPPSIDNSNHTSADIKSQLLFRGYKDQLTPIPQGQGQGQGQGDSADLNAQFVVDSFLGAGFSISRLSFDPTGQLLSVVDDSGTTTIFSVAENGFWVPYYTPTIEDVIDDQSNQQDPDINPYQFLRQQQQLKEDEEVKFIQSLNQGKGRGN